MLIVPWILKQYTLLFAKVKSKIDMLDNLLEIEVAYNLLSTEDSTDKVGSQKDREDTNVTHSNF